MLFRGCNADWVVRDSGKCAGIRATSAAIPVRFTATNSWECCSNVQMPGWADQPRLAGAEKRS
jgi:hypothetical protein